MKKILTLLFCVLCFSCDDGDFNLPAFDFAEKVYDCDLIGNKYVLYKLAESEALIITLTTNQIKDEVTDDEPILVPISETNVIYRTFDSDISPSYFCGTIPPTTPLVLANWVGVAGNTNFIVINTYEELDEDDVLIGYRNEITFDNLKLKNGENFIIYEESYFGIFITYL